MGRKNTSNVCGETASHSGRIQCQSNETHLGDLTCSICLEIFVEPMQCKQGHVFCKACIERTLKKKKECPMDRSSLRKKELCRARVVENIIDRMRVRCPHASQHADGAEHCDWLGPVSERQAHVDDECGYTLVPCPHDGCEVRVQRRMVMEHAASCEQRVEACKLCSVGVVVAHHAQHEEECPMKRVTCPCGALPRRKELEEHEAVCPMVKCAFAVCGCTVGTLLRKDVAGHERDAAAAHAALALQELGSLKEEVKTLRAEQKRNAAMGPVSVRWRVEKVKAKMTAGGDFFSKEILMRSGTGPQTPLSFKVKIVFDKETQSVGLFIHSLCDNPADMTGTSVTLCNADNNEGLERTFFSGDMVYPQRCWGWNKVASFAELRESHITADGSIIILATLDTRQVLEV